MPESLGGVAYSASASTRSSSRAVLQMLEREALDQGLEIRDRAPSYVNLAQKKAPPGGVTAAIVVGVLIVLVVLALTAVTPLLIVLLPVALAPALPFAIGRGNSITVAAFEAGETTLITADGRSSQLVGKVIDEFIAKLTGPQPTPVAENRSAGPKRATKKRPEPNAVSQPESSSVNESDNGDDNAL